MSKYPESRGLILRKTRESLSNSTLVTWEDKVVPRHHSMTKNCTRNVRQSYIFPNGSEVVVGGLDKANKILSAEYDMAVISQAEEIAEDDFQKLIGCMRNGAIPYQQILCEANPSFDHHWLIRRPSITRFLSKHTDNPQLWDEKEKIWTPFGEKYLSKLGSLTGVSRDRYLNGLWVSSEGMVFKEWDPNKHMMDAPVEFKYVFCAIDWGFTEPTVVQWYGVDGDKRLYLLKEYYHTGKLTSEIITHIKNRNSQYHYAPTEYVCDSAEPDRIQEMRNAGLNAKPTKKILVERGIELCRSRLVSQKDDKPRFYVMRDYSYIKDSSLSDKFKPTNFVEEIQAYNYVKPDEPSQEDEHAISAWRYAVCYLDKGSSVYSPSPVAQTNLPKDQNYKDLMTNPDIWSSI